MDTRAGPVPAEGAWPPPPAREPFSPRDAAARRASAETAAHRREVQAALGRRTAPLWPVHATVRPTTAGATRQDWKQVRRLAGLELQHHALVLRRISTAYVVAVAEPCFEAGWSVADVLNALDWTPQGVRYTHDAVTGIENPGAWFAARLRAWAHQDGTPMRSVDQRRAAETEQRRAEAIAAAQRHAARRSREQTAGVEDGAAGVVARSQDPADRDRRPFRVRWAAQIAAGRAEANGRAGRQ
ncbi:hypothetical protein ACH9D2_12350 [Kocuria sp. M4R2S49]|uniref:hypothetical protein n=1 Tax=Kocuria rhizosphaericola TaxID=3376284 RepID=UPI00378E5F61